MAVAGQQRGWLLFGLLLMLLPPAPHTAAAEGVRAGFTPAWGGRFFPGQESEIAVRLLSGSSGPFELLIRGGDIPVRYRGRFSADTPLRIWIPLRPRPGQAIDAILTRPGNDTPLTFRPPPFTAVSTRLRVSTDPTEAKSAGGPTPPLLVTEPGALPRTSSGYGPVQHLSIRASQLTSLDPEQVTALGHFIQNCGNLQVSGASATLLQRLRGISGCNGRFVQQSGQPVPMTHLPPLPGADLLRGLNRRPAMNRIRLPALLLASHLLLLSLLALYRRRPLLPLAATGLACLALLLLWPRQHAATRLINWAELESGAAAARFSALLIVDGKTDSEHELPVPARLGLPHAPKGGGLSFVLDAQQPMQEQLLIHTRPFSRQWYLFHGATPIQTGLRLNLTATGPTVHNSGDTPTSAAMLGWNDEVHQVPPLRPAERWHPTELSRLPGHTPLRSLLRSRSSGDQPALLLPWNPADLGPTGTSLPGLGWLLIRPQGKKA